MTNQNGQVVYALIAMSITASVARLVENPSETGSRSVFLAGRKKRKQGKKTDGAQFVQGRCIVVVRRRIPFEGAIGEIIGVLIGERVQTMAEDRLFKGANHGFLGVGNPVRGRPENPSWIRRFSGDGFAQPFPYREKTVGRVVRSDGGK